MTRIFIPLFLLLICLTFNPAYGQDQPGVVKYPTGIDSSDSLIRAADNASSTTAAPVTSSATSILLVNASLFPSSGMGLIESEKFTWTSKSGSTLNGVTRGVGGTTAVAHPVSASVRVPVLSDYHNTLAASLVATQTKIGSGACVSATGKFMKGTGAGTSCWGDILLADVAGLQAALDAKATAAALTSEASTRSSADTTLQSNITAEAAARAAADAILQPLNSDLTAIAAIAPSNDDVIQRKSGAWVSRSMTQLKADFALSISDVSGLQAALNLKANLVSPVFTGHSAFGSSGSIDPNGNPAVISLYEVFTSPLLLKNGIYSRIDVRPTSNSTTQHAAFYGETFSISGDTSNIGTMLGAFGRVEHTAATTLATGTGLLSNVLNTGAGTITSGRALNGIIQNSSTGTIATAIGAAGQTNNISTGTITEARGISGAVSNTGNGTYTTAYGAKVTFVNTGTTSKIVTGYGFYSTAITQSGGASIDNLYGAYLSDWSSYSANSYNLYSAGATARNYIEGKLGVGVTANDAAAKVQIDSTTQGFLPPRMTTTQRDAISAPPRGLQIYNTTTDQMNYYNGTSWVAF